jgi:hypothetical protein
MMHNHQITAQFRRFKKLSKSFNLFWFGFLVFALGSIASATKYRSNIKIFQAFQLVGLISIVAGAVYLIQSKINNRYLKILFTLFCIWSVTIIMRDIEFNFTFLKDFIFDYGNGGLVYFAPLILLFPKNIAFYQKAFDVIIFAGILYLLLDIIFIKNLLTPGRDALGQSTIESLSELSMPAGFILLTYRYQSAKRNILAIGIIILTLLFTIIRARRGLLFITSNIIITSYLLYLFNTNRKIMVIYLSILFISLGALYSTSLYKTSSSKIFGYLVNRGSEDTRTGGELYFYADMKIDDWIIGKGLRGQYFAPNITEGQVSNFRNLIETGYLQVILKGGLINLGLLIMIAFPACIKGIFFSKNILSKASGIWIFLFMINLYPQIAVAFNLSYLLVWISIGICYSKKIRNMSNDDIQSELTSLNKEGVQSNKIVL